MAQPFPPASPPPPNPQQPAFAPSPAGSPFQPGAFQAPPPPPAKSGGCFKGCCIVAVILGVLGVIGVVVIGMKWKQMYAAMIRKTVVDQSDLTPDEKKETEEIFEKALDAMTGPKAGDQKFAEQFQRAMNDLQAAAQDQKIEGRELRPVFARMKQALKDAGYTFSTNLFPMVSWKVTVTAFDEERKAEVVKVLGQKMSLPEAAAASILAKLPAEVLTGVTEPEAQDFLRKLEEAGCDATMEPLGAEAPK